MFIRNLAYFVRNLDDNEFIKCLTSLPYFKTKPAYQTIAKEFDEYCKKEGISENREWEHFSELFREIKDWDKLDLDYMYARIKRFENELGNLSFFKEKDFGSLTKPERNLLLTNLERLAKKLLYQVYPSIEALLTFDTHSRQIHTPIIRGKIDWQHTILNAIKESGGMPTTFTCLIHERRFDTPENLLLLMAINWIHNDAKTLINLESIEEFSSKEKNLLNEIIHSSEKILNRTPLQEIRNQAESWSHLERQSKQTTKLRNDMTQRIFLNIVKQRNYIQLEKWIDEYITYNFQRYRFSVDFTMDRLESVDTMYELWILLEFASFMRKIPDFLVESEVGNNEIIGFKISHNKKSIFLRYQAEEYSAQTRPKMNPDFSFEINSKNVPIILDAKNWRLKKKRDAIDKMIIYLVELNLLHPSVGILFFSNYEKLHGQEKIGPFLRREIQVENKKWSLCTCVLLPSRELIYIKQKEEVFGKIIEMLSEKNLL